jgi:post-segregation antitoxin (ccd killing protein)
LQPEAKALFVGFWAIRSAAKPFLDTDRARPSVYIVCIARLNVYLPDELADAIRPLEWNLSSLLQSAVRERLDTLGLDNWLSRLEPESWAAAGHGQTLASLEAVDEGRSDG